MSGVVFYYERAFRVVIDSIKKKIANTVELMRTNLATHCLFTIKTVT